MIAHIDDAAFRAFALRELAKHLACAHRWHESERIAASIYQLSRRHWAYALQDIAIQSARAHRWDDAKRIIRDMQVDQDGE